MDDKIPELTLAPDLEAAPQAPQASRRPPIGRLVACLSIA